MREATLIILGCTSQTRYKGEKIACMLINNFICELYCDLVISINISLSVHKLYIYIYIYIYPMNPDIFD